jgi:hypothetical protein
MLQPGTGILKQGKHTHPEDLKKAKEALEKHLNQKNDFYNVEIRMKHKDGYWIWLMIVEE